MKKLFVSLLLLVIAISTSATITNENRKISYVIDNTSTFTYSYTFDIITPNTVFLSFFDTDGAAVSVTMNRVTSSSPSANEYYVDETNSNVVIGGTGTLQTQYSSTITQLLITRTVDLTQESAFPTATSLRSTAIEAALDKNTMLTQQLSETVSRALVIPIQDDTSQVVDLPAAAVRANKFLAFDALGNPTASDTPGGGVVVSAAMEPVVGAATVFVAKTLMNLDRVVDVKDYGAVGDGDRAGTGNGTDDTAAINLAIAVANARDPTGDPGGTLYFPPGDYMVTTGDLTTITSSVYGPGAYLQSLTHDDNYIIQVNYTGAGKDFTLGGITGPHWANDQLVPANHHSTGLQIIAADHATFDIRLIEGLKIGIHATATTGAIAQCTFNIQTLISCGGTSSAGISLFGTTTARVEANNFHINFIDNCYYGIILNNDGAAGAYCNNNHFEIIVMELNRDAGAGARDDLTGIYLAGQAQPTRITGNTFIIRDQLLGTPGTGGGLDIKTESGVIGNYFKFPFFDFSVITTNAQNTFDGDSEIGGLSVAAERVGRSILHRNAIPTAGYWTAGDIILNNEPSVGEPFGWVCTVAGSQGTWTPLGTVGSGMDLLSVTTIPLNANGDTTIYTVPTGRTLLPGMALLVAGADAGTSDISIGADGTETDFVGVTNLDNLDALNDMVLIAPIPSATPATLKSYAATTVIQAQVANQAGGATNTLYFFGSLQ